MTHGDPALRSVHRLHAGGQLEHLGGDEANASLEWIAALCVDELAPGESVHVELDQEVEIDVVVEDDGALIIERERTLSGRLALAMARRMVPVEAPVVSTSSSRHAATSSKRAVPSIRLTDEPDEPPIPPTRSRPSATFTSSRRGDTIAYEFEVEPFDDGFIVDSPRPPAQPLDMTWDDVAGWFQRLVDAAMPSVGRSVAVGYLRDALKRAGGAATRVDIARSGQVDTTAEGLPLDGADTPDLDAVIDAWKARCARILPSRDPALTTADTPPWRTT